MSSHWERPSAARPASTPRGVAVPTVSTATPSPVARLTCGDGAGSSGAVLLHHYAAAASRDPGTIAAPGSRTLRAGPSCPVDAQLPQRVQPLRREFVAPGSGVRDPHAQLHRHRPCLAVGRDWLAVAARYRPVGAFPFHPLREGRKASLERLLRLSRRTSGCQGGRRGFSGLDAQRGQPFLLIGEELCSGARFLLPPPPLARRRP